jgi:hypothetical protein
MTGARAVKDKWDVEEHVGRQVKRTVRILLMQRDLLKTKLNPVA